MISITTKIICGKGEEVNRLFEASPVSKGVNILLVERSSVTLRQHSGRLWEKILP